MAAYSPAGSDVPTNVADWAREHPSFFFDESGPSFEAMRRRLVEGVGVLLASPPEILMVGNWLAVGSAVDWFELARFRANDLDHFTVMLPFPEFGDNSVRPEFVVGSFAESAILLGPAGTIGAKGHVDENDPILPVLRASNWVRAVAFRGLHGV